MRTATQMKARSVFLNKIEKGIYTLRQNPCLCGGKSDTLLAKKDRYEIPIRTVLCNKCGLVRSDPYYTEETLAQFYTNEYRSLYTGSHASTEGFFLEQRIFGSDICNFLSKRVYSNNEVTGKKIFEIGCGAGGILEAFREKGNEVFGCDYGSAYVEFGQRKGLTLVAGGATTLTPFGVADVVILNHTLEHMTRPNEELEQIKKLLSPSGVLYIALPGIFYVHNTYRGRFETGYLQNAHVWYFTLDTLNDFLARDGFELIYGDESIKAVYKMGEARSGYTDDAASRITEYLENTKRWHWYYELKKFSLRHTAFETLRRLGPLYRLIRRIYRSLKKTR